MRIPIPKILKPAEGQYILVTMPNYWGRGEDLKKALKQLNSAGGYPESFWRVYSVEPTTFVNAMGQLEFPIGHNPVMLAESNPSYKKREE